MAATVYVFGFKTAGKYGVVWVDSSFTQVRAHASQWPVDKGVKPQKAYIYVWHEVMLSRSLTRPHLFEHIQVYACTLITLCTHDLLTGILSTET